MSARANDPSGVVPIGREHAAFFDVVLTQRAHRSFRPDPVGDDLIERVLEAATHAPSAENRQPWVFVVVRDRGLREGLASAVRAAWDGGVREHVRPHLSERFFASVARWATVGLGETPVIVFVCGDTSSCDASLLPSSVFPATQNLLLAAHALGLGALLSTLPVLVDPQLKARLELPAHLQPMAAVCMGWPARTLGKPHRVSFRAKAFRDRYGNTW